MQIRILPIILISELHLGIATTNRTSIFANCKYKRGACFLLKNTAICTNSFLLYIVIFMDTCLNACYYGLVIH